MKVYSVTATEELISRLIEKGYEAIQTDEGVCGIGNWYLLAPDHPQKDNGYFYYNIEIREKPLNCWSSGQTVRRFEKLSERQKKEIEEWEERICAE